MGGCGGHLVSGDVHTRSNHWLKGRCSKGFCHSAEITSKQIDYISGARAVARGGSGEGILGWHRRAISAYTWCVTEKGPRSKWLSRVPISVRRKYDKPLEQFLIRLSTLPLHYCFSSHFVPSVFCTHSMCVQCNSISRYYWLCRKCISLRIWMPCL